MSSKDFIKKHNTDVLFEVVLDYDEFKNSSEKDIQNFKEFFNRIIPQFYEAEKNNISELLPMNRKFLQYIISVLENGKKQTQLVNDKPLFTIEEIKEKRQTMFDEDLERRQRDFSNTMSLPVPETPKFGIGVDSPMDEMDVVVKRTIAQRNMDMNQIYNSNTNKKDVEKWLTPSETSIKMEKTPKNYEYKNSKQQQQQQIHYIKIDNENLDNNFLKNEIIDLDERQKLYDKPREKKSNNSKQIKWGENDIKEIDISQTETNFDFFKHLKKTNNNINMEETQFNSPLLNQFETTEKLTPPTNINEYSIYAEKRFDELQEQIKNLNNTLESHMDRCNNTLTIIYNLLTKKENETKQHNTYVNVKPENPQSNILM